MFYTQWISEQAPAHHNVLNRQRHLMLLIISDREMFSISISLGFFPQIVVNFLLDVSWMVRFFSLLSTWLSWYSRVAWSKANKRNVSQKPSTPIHLVESHYIFGSVLVIRCEHESHFACEEQRKRERKTREKRLRQGVLCFGNSIEPKIRGFKWKDNGSWAALCHYLTHSIRFGSSTFPCFQLIHTHTLSLSLILEQYIHHIIFGNVTHESLACGTCHLRNAFHDDYERRRRHRHQMSVLYMVGTRMWWHSYRFLRSAFHTKMKNYTHISLDLRCECHIYI